MTHKHSERGAPRGLKGMNRWIVRPAMAMVVAGLVIGGHAAGGHAAGGHAAGGHAAGGHAAGGLAAAPAFAEMEANSAGVGDYRCTDPSKVYFGKCCLFRSPCTISADQVYRHIPEYQEILRRSLTEKDVDYHFLMKKASTRFADAVKKMAKAKKRDLVAETGTITKVRKKAPAIPDYTQQTVSHIK